MVFSAYENWHFSVFLDVTKYQKPADVWKTDVWEFQAFSQTFLQLRFSLGNQGKDSKNLNSQTWPGTQTSFSQTSAAF